MFGFSQAIVSSYRGGDLGPSEARALLASMGFGDRAETGNLAGLIIGITIAAVVGVAVAIPVINDVVADSNATGTTLTVLDLLDLFVGLLILVAIASPLMRRT